MPTHIASLQNGRIKNVVKLHHRRHRDAHQLMVVEGAREIGRALANGFVPQEVYICPELVVGGDATAVSQQLHTLKTALFTVTPELFAKMAYREESDGLLILLPYWQRPLSALHLSANPFLAVIEGGEKPGNLGAILRTAAAAGVDTVIISEKESGEGTDVFNPNVIRASLGALFTVPVATASTPAVIAWLREQGIQLAVATPEGELLYTAVNLRGPVALVMGSEAHGLSEEWLTAADLRLAIPMHGQIDSLNLSVSAALLLYEVVRQRGNKGTQ
jgi:TrmH family RNA methyltransferase